MISTGWLARRDRPDRARKTAIDTENGPVDLGPGMAVTAEIKTGHRREYLLSPARAVPAGRDARTMRRLLKSLLLVSVALVCSLEILNFSDFCYDQFRYYSRRQLLDANENPNCCSVNTFDTRLDMWPRLFGFYVLVVDVWYRYRESGPEQFLHSEIFMSPADTFDASKRSRSLCLGNEHDTARTWLSIS